MTPITTVQPQEVQVVDKVTKKLLLTVAAVS